MFDLPDHLVIPVDENGDGPADNDTAVGLACWCGDNQCREVECSLGFDCDDTLCHHD